MLLLLTEVCTGRNFTNEWRVDNQTRQVVQLSQRDRAAGCINFGQKWKTGTGRQYFMDIIGLSSTTRYNRHAKLSYRIRRKRKIEGNFVADFLQAKCDFTLKTAVLRF